MLRSIARSSRTAAPPVGAGVGADAGVGASAGAGFARVVPELSRAARVMLGCTAALLVTSVMLAMVWMPKLAPALAPWLYLAAVAPWLVLIDLRERRLPNRLVLPGFVAWVLGALWVVLADSGAGWPRIAASVVAGGAYALLLGALAWWGGMGGGDLKLGTLLGLALGLVSPVAAVLALPLAFFAGAIVAVVVLATSPKGERRGRSIPFGPCLLLAGGFSLAAGVLLASQ